MTRQAIPISILVGSALVAVALYLGLSHAGKDPEGGVKTSEQPAASVSPAPPSEVIPKASQADVDAAAMAALEKARPVMLEKCWGPAVKASPDPATSVYVYDMTFDGTTGKAIGRGISELRDEPSRPDVAQCLRELPMEHEITPPGYNARVELRFTLP